MFTDDGLSEPPDTATTIESEVISESENVTMGAGSTVNSPGTEQPGKNKKSPSHV